MKTFIKYDFFFQLTIYFFSIIWSGLNSEFQGNFAICLFFIGCSQTVSYIIRLNKKGKNTIFKIYTTGYCIFILSIVPMIFVKPEFMFWFTAILINIMAVLFLISGFIDYKNLKSENL